MAYIQPYDTTIELYQNVPLDKSYRNTVHYSSSTDQYNDFQQYKYKSYEKQSYQRWGLGTVRLEEKHDNIYNCNYMIFYNPTLNKKIYCFVDGVGYVSDNVTEVYYTIDVMQTYMFNYTLGKCFVEREHVYTDIQGQNTQPEGLELGDSYINSGTNIINITIDSWRYVILATQTPSGVTPTGIGTRNGIPDGLITMVFDNVGDLSSMIESYVNSGLEDAIIQLYMAPTNVVNQSKQIEFTHNHLNNYNPKNKKLLTYPYCFVQIGNNLGNFIELHYEHFGDSVSEDSKITLKLNLTTLDYPQPIMVLEPSYNLIDPNTEYQLNYSVFPTCAFSGDSFKVWWAQNKNTYVATMNAIQSNYDTNVQIANNNYAQAELNAQTARTTAMNSATTSVNNAQMQMSVSKQQAQNNFNTATSGVSGQLSRTIEGARSNMNTANQWLSDNTGINSVNNSLYSIPIVGDVLSSVTNSISGLSDSILNSLDSTNINATNTLNNANLSADLSNRVAVSTASTNIKNAQLAYSTALKNATISQKSSNLSALTTAQNATASLVAKKQDAMHQPSTAHGQTSCDGANVVLNRVGFRIEEKCIQLEYLQRIDEYFTMYGYAVNTCKYPNINNRKYFTYLKTTNCNIVNAHMDTTTRQTIESIYNNGVTTWKQLSQVGNYDLDNTPNGAQY